MSDTLHMELHKTGSLSLFLLILCLGSFPCSDAGNLLVIPMDGSHYISMVTLLETLGQQGHRIVVLVPESSLHIKASTNYILKTYPVQYTTDQLRERNARSADDFFAEIPSFKRIMKSFERLTNIRSLMHTTCRHLLQNKEVIGYLRGQLFDAALLSPIFPCGHIIVEYLGIPSVAFLKSLPCGIDHQATQCPNPASYVPRFFTMYTDHMSFSQRIWNALLWVSDGFLCKFLYNDFGDLASEFLQKEVSMLDLYRRTSIWIVKYDFVFEFIRPVMPNMVLIGGINCINRKTLTHDFEKLVNSSGEHGFVVFSLGSMVSEIPMDKAMDMAEAFRSIPQTVIWRYTGKVPSNLGSNTHLVKWLPQNDLLAHPKARAFITHAGSHGIYEGICNAVPMVMLPLFGDQMDNAKRMESRGAGVTLNVLDMTPEDLINALDSVINKPSYKENVQRLSALHLDRPIHPLDLAVHWVEFVMRHKGAPHLRPAAHDLNWIQYHSLDVFAFLLAVLVTTFFISFKCCAYTCRRCCGRKSRPKSKSKKE
ncbi:UDP-glucuronosyltransferase 1A1-like isoform X1 [Bufo gargarizans]|uniref:UDP-glucuronosyltransferase 1A1-like isoform X1 n=1 Tax=Bufo gargarizans TaxID=30331 RepID=UPI001CF31C26|nr:UDP-glucuronosyltransferase 1A1-like isoform X1 [Bufo gargarizans]